jgi:hypothetical protein
VETFTTLPAAGVWLHNAHELGGGAADVHVRACTSGGFLVAIPPIPIKTAEGQAELGTRQRRLSQRHRTVLLLVDGRRSEAQVRHLAQQAGAADTCFDELIDLGMIAVPPPSDEPLSTIPIPRPPAEDDAPLHVDIPIDEPAPAPPPPSNPQAHDDHSLLPASRTLQPESVLNELAMGEVAIEDVQDFDALEIARTEDSAMEEARGILLAAVRREAPLTGSLTMLRLRRARTREELTALIDEVEARIIKPYRSLASQQVLRRARVLLDSRLEPIQSAL